MPLTPALLLTPEPSGMGVPEWGWSETWPKRAKLPSLHSQALLAQGIRSLPSVDCGLSEEEGYKSELEKPPLPFPERLTEG